MNDFRNIWIPYADRFYRAAYYMLESGQDAEDAVQELYLKLWKSRESLNGLRNPTAYGMSLLKNICIDRIRRREVRKAEPLDSVMPLEGLTPERQEEARDLLNRTIQELHRLPHKQAEVMRLLVLEDLDYNEISDRMGLSKIYIRVLVSTARKILKQRLKI